ncbi:radical SAM protein [Spongiivirga sp. MCCC 1A20706]|uniref:radical SAM protein n=1 Tax=Spongiivirga sp. MCCC 1A20706 TaxID=3160963 RepID=UPI0039773628
MLVNSYAQNVIIYKIVQTCNLNCTYCYVYNKGDDSWKSRPKQASFEVTKKLCSRIVEHYYRHNLKQLYLEIHGGEPLLLGVEKFRKHIEIIMSECSQLNLDIFVQTNGLLLNDEWLKLFYDFNIPFSISIDGPSIANDKNRVYRNGKGSFDELFSILNRLQKNKIFDSLCHGYLCVIDPESEGDYIFNWFYDNNFKKVDLLLPDLNHTEIDNISIEKTSRFLIKAFDRWLEIGKEAPSVRFFEYAIRSKTGLKPNLDALGGDLSAISVIESDGSIGCHDVMRINGGIYNRDFMNISKYPLGVHVDFFNIKKIQKPCAKCLNCKHFTSCGGGYLPHRYDGIDFNNPSYYCNTLYSFFEHVEKRLLEMVPKKMWSKINTA